MSTVILVGFSTAGKSHYLDKIKERGDTELSTFDSDKFVSSDYDEHIYNIFLEKVKPNDDREEALQYIKQREIEAIKYLGNLKKQNLLVAAGPFITIRPTWDDYIASNPNCNFIYLQKNPEEVYNGLLERREKQINKGLDKHISFGSWDKDVMTDFNKGKYKLLEKKEAISRIKKLMSTVTPKYEKLAKGKIFQSEELKSDDSKSEKLIELIISYLQK